MDDKINEEELKGKLDLVRAILGSIIIIIQGEGRPNVLWIEPPLDNMICQIVHLEDMYYKNPPDAEDEYDEGYRFTENQLDILMDWIKRGEINKNKDLFKDLGGRLIDTKGLDTRNRK